MTKNEVILGLERNSETINVGHLGVEQLNRIMKIRIFFNNTLNIKVNKKKSWQKQFYRKQKSNKNNTKKN